MLATERTWISTFLIQAEMKLLAHLATPFQARQSVFPTHHSHLKTLGLR